MGDQFASRRQGAVRGFAKHSSTRHSLVARHAGFAPFPMPRAPPPRARAVV